MGFINAHLMGTWDPNAEPAAAVKQLAGMVIVESLTDADAVSDVLTFAEPIKAVEIWHDETGLQEFTVNGITLNIGPKGWRSLVGGTPSAEVTVPTGITCAVSRCV